MKPRMKSDERRAAIVSAAVRLFAEKGFRGATTRELAAAVGVTEPVLYQHFRTKNDLYSAIIDAKSKEGYEKAGDFLTAYEQDDPRLFFTQLGRLLIEHYENDPDFSRLLLFSGLERHELARRFYERQLLRFYRMVAEYIRRQIKAGAFRPVNAAVAARGFIGMITYHKLVELLFGVAPAAPGRKLVDEMVTTFLEGIRNRP